MVLGLTQVAALEFADNRSFKRARDNPTPVMLITVSAETALC